MASVTVTMQAVGCEQCAGCQRTFGRGEQMLGVAYSDGDPAGWHCENCMEIWRTEGEQKLPRWQETTKGQ